MKTVGERLKEMRGVIPQRDIAQSAGVSTSLLSMMENSDRLTIESLWKLAQIYRVSVVDILQGTKYDVPQNRIAELEARIEKLESVYVSSTDNPRVRELEALIRRIFALCDDKSRHTDYIVRLVKEEISDTPI